MHFSISLASLAAAATAVLALSGPAEGGRAHRALARARGAEEGQAQVAVRSLPAPSPPLEKRTTKVSKKKGLGYNDAKLTRKFGKSIAWVYNWADAKDGTLTSGVEYVPQLWGSSTTGWSSAAKKAIKRGTTHLLGFNEPDLDSQSNLSAAAAAKLYKKHITPFHSSAHLISPAVTNGGAPMGLTWLADFMAECGACKITGIALHWYDSATNVAYLKSYLEGAHEQFPGKHIHLTEFAGSGMVAEQQAFLKEVIPWMEGKSWIARYAYFGDFAGTLVDVDGTLTALGRTYKSTV